ncbi:MAG: peptidyl-prolyl cis-trans isomerase [Treponema sp.]|jgi:hypothetical protein|nr:peptidyl-prolyl cis-trans isomerase [Treponema sp.]
MASREKKTKISDDDSQSDILRRFKHNPAIFIGTVIVLVLVIVSFVLVPAFVPESRRGGENPTFGYYNKAPITWVPGNYFTQSWDQISRYYQSVLDADTLQYAYPYIWRLAYNQTIVHTAILQEMKISKYTVPERVVNRQVARLPYFQEGDRGFSPALYNQMSEASRQALWRQVQEELVKNTYQKDLFGLLKPVAEIKFFSNMARNTRTFNFISFNIDDYPDSEYLAYALANNDIFRTIHLSRISVNTSEREARQILNSVNNGSITFEDAASGQLHDIYSDKGGDMGIRHIYELDRDIPDAQSREKILNLKKGGISEIIKVDDATWAFFKINDELKNADFDDNTVFAKLRSYVRGNEWGRMEDWAVARANEFIALAQMTDFATAASGKSVSSFGPVPINYGDVDLFTSIGSSVSGISNVSTNENFWKAAFSTPLNTPSQPIVQTSNVIVLFPTEEIEADDNQIEDIILRYSTDWFDNTLEQSLIVYFFNSPKMDDRFDAVYNRVFQSDY